MKTFEQQGFGLLGLLIVAAIIAAGYWMWSAWPAVKYWFVKPTNFTECVKATDGVIIKTSPEQCEFRGQNFINTNQDTPPLGLLSK